MVNMIDYVEFTDHALERLRDTEISKGTVITMLKNTDEECCTTYKDLDNSSKILYCERHNIEVVFEKQPRMRYRAMNAVVFTAFHPENPDTRYTKERFEKSAA